MNAADLLSAFELPRAAMVERRVPKTLLLEHGAATAADKRSINAGIEELVWVAALKPTTIGVPAYRDETREVLEIAVLQVALRKGGKGGRLIELAHRAIPYPVVLVAEGEDLSASLATKRWSQGEKGKTVLDDKPVVALCDKAAEDHVQADFLRALALRHQPQTTLYALYQGWVSVVVALRASRHLGKFEIRRDEDEVGERRGAVEECERLESEIEAVTRAASRETQLGRRVELNAKLNGLRAALAAARAKL